MENVNCTGSVPDKLSHTRRLETKDGLFVRTKFNKYT